MYTGSFVAQQAGCLHVGSKFECYRILRCASFDLCLLWWGFVEAAWFFFFSSRRRHTRFDCDWSDVCSSDLRTHGTGLPLWLISLRRRDNNCASISMARWWAANHCPEESMEDLLWVPPPCSLVRGTPG